MYLWENRETCIVSLNEQRSREWNSLRKCRITMSIAAAVCDHLSPFFFDRFYGSKEELAKIIVGVSDKTSTEEELIRMQNGTDAEPFVREKYSELINKPIKEIGLAIWKQDYRIGASLDGEISETEGIEIKAPQHMYRPLINHFDAVQKGFIPPPSYHSHIYTSHYDQMNGCGVITGKKVMHYVVMSLETKDVFVQEIPVDYEYWEEQQYPKIKKFYEEYVEPTMTKYGVRRFDPPLEN